MVGNHRDGWRFSVEENAHLYRSNGGKAIGWVDKKQESDRELLNIDNTDGDVVLYVVKATRRVGMELCGCLVGGEGSFSQVC